MPIYEFACEQCGKESEILVRSSKWQGTPCPHCGSKKLAKKFSTFASSTAGSSSSPGPAPGGGGCSRNPGSCGMCGTGRPHSH